MRSPSRTTRASCSRSSSDHSSSRSACENAALAVQRRLERHDDLGHRRRVGGDGGCGDGALHVRWHATRVEIYAPGIDSEARHTANVLGAVVDALARDVEAATAASASGPGGRAAAVAALAAFASGSPIDRLAWSLGLSHSRVVRLVDQLEADGHVTRARGTADRRTVQRDAHRLGLGAREGDRDRPAVHPARGGRCAGRRRTARRSIASARPSSPGGSTPCARPSGHAACASRTPAVIRERCPVTHAANAHRARR